jgi:hypothetical protein
MFNEESGRVSEELAGSEMNAVAVAEESPLPEEVP